MTNNKINKLKNLILLYTNTENMTNNKLAVEWLAKSYVDLLTKLNNEEISLKEFEIQYIKLLEQAKEMEKERMIQLVQGLKDYTHESHTILGHDERDASEFVDIFYKETYGGGEQ